MLNLTVKKIINLIFKPARCVLGRGSKIYADANISNNGPLDDMVIGDNSHIKGELLILGHGGKIIIGDYCFIGPNTRIWSGELIEIQDRVLISHNCNILDNDIHPIDPELRHNQFKEIIFKGQPKKINLRDKKVIVENDVWIGANCTILKGVTIGRGSIVAANSLVTKSIPANVIYSGNPAKFLRNIE